jgi:hypothetical protein
VKKNIVYIVHGPARYFDEARFSILTLVHLLRTSGCSDYRIWVWTARPQLLPRHEVIIYKDLDESSLEAMRGPLGLVHRIKLIVLAEAAAAIKEDFVYVDGDSRWLQLPDVEFEELQRSSAKSRGLLYMNGIDGTLSEQFIGKYYRYLTRNHAALKALFGIAEGPWRIWNAGVLGMRYSSSKVLLGESLALCDALVPWLTPRIYVEQLALNLVATKYFDIHPFQRAIDHYWDCSFEASIHLCEFFKRMPEDAALFSQAETAYNLAWDRRLFRAMRRHPRYRFRRWRQRLRASFAKRFIDIKARKLRKRSGISKSHP